MKNLADVDFLPFNNELTLALPPVARRIVTDTFAPLYEANAFEAFCDQAYGAQGPMAKDAEDTEVSWRVATLASKPIGYAKLAPLRAPAPESKSGALELKQISVLSGWHGER